MGLTLGLTAGWSAHDVLPMSLARRLLLRGFAAATALPWNRLEQALAEPRKAQLQTLRNLLRQARLETPIDDYAAFRELPLQRYDDLEPRILAAMAGKGPHLTRSIPKAYEPTSGSSGASKLIPYTPALLGAFTRLFLCWAHDVLAHGPSLNGGRIYFSVSPQFHETEHGLADDSEYLEGPTAILFRRFTLVPPAVKQLHDPKDFFRVVSAYLLAAPDLELISVWSPSFLLAILDYIAANRSELALCLARGEVSGGGRSFACGSPEPHRIRALKQDPLPLETLFPALRLISCWGAGNAAVGFARLQARFPQALVQAKGLLATEAPITLPSIRYGTFLPLLTEVFFEFIDQDDGRILLLDELGTGRTYELVISQAGGLLRYRLGDLVRVTGRARATPCFDFVARAGSVSDLVGEKLSEAFVAGVAAQVCPGAYLCLVPDALNSRYLLFSDRPLDEAGFEAGLMASVHYGNARKLGQLQPLAAAQRADLAQALKAFYVTRRGMRAGDIKDRTLYERESDGELLAWLAPEGTVS